MKRDDDQQAVEGEVENGLGADREGLGSSRGVPNGGDRLKTQDEKRTGAGRSLTGATSGYGRPPAAYRFVKGFSGNPRGRPKGRRKAKDGKGSENGENPSALALMIAKEGKSVVRVETEHGGYEEMPMMELLVRTMMERAAAGDFRALKFVLEHGLCPSTEPGHGAGRRKAHGGSGSRKALSKDRQADAGADRDGPSTMEELSDCAAQELLGLRKLEADLMNSIAYSKRFLDENGTSPLAATYEKRLETDQITLDSIRALIMQFEFMAGSGRGDQRSGGG